MIVLVACPVAVLAACGPQDREARLPTSSRGEARQVTRMNPENLRRLAGVDRLPMPANQAAMQASMRRHWPTDPRAVGASVTVDVSVDESGRVTAVEPAPVSSAGGIPTRMILEDRDGTQHVQEIRRDASALPAAEAVLRDVPFTPALRDGQPVAHTFRMTISFTPHAGSEP